MFDNPPDPQPMSFVGLRAHAERKPQQTVIIRIYPAKNGQGRFDAYLGDTFIVTSRTPFFSSARWLMGTRKYPADTILIMRHGDTPQNAMIGLIGALAQKTVTENEKSGPRVTKYTPHPQALARGRAQA